MGKPMAEWSRWPGSFNEPYAAGQLAPAIRLGYHGYYCQGLCSTEGQQTNRANVQCDTGILGVVLFFWVE